MNLAATQILKMAAELYATRRVVNKALPEFDEETSQIRFDLIDTLLEHKDNISAHATLMEYEGKKYTDCFYEPLVDFACICEAVGTYRERQRNISPRTK